MLIQTTPVIFGVFYIPRKVATNTNMQGCIRGSMGIRRTDADGAFIDSLEINTICLQIL